jgi:NADPH-dependent 2,4-dienoyl-CoA reductase/sulfur reductase-like enzyme
MGMRVEPQKKSGVDLFKLADKASGALEVGFYYKSKTLIKSKVAWNKSRELMRTAPGNLGEIKPLGAKPRFEEVNATPEVLVVGGGVAGLEAASGGRQERNPRHAGRSRTVAWRV